MFDQKFWNNFQDKLLKYLINGDEDLALHLSRMTIDEGVSPEVLFSQGITPVLVEVGNRFESLDIFLPEMVEAAKIVQKINQELIHPLLQTKGKSVFQTKGRVVLATIQGDLHDIGKNIVALMLRVNGFEVIDMGVNVSPFNIVECAVHERADIIAMSSLLTPCLPYMKDVVELLNGRSIRNNYAVIIGGAAPTLEFADKIGADAQGHSAEEAVRICSQIMGSKV
jgi:methylmalonyl-CoA mutase cobalamin-binding domain/chain